MNKKIILDRAWSNVAVTCKSEKGEQVEIKLLMLIYKFRVLITNLMGKIRDNNGKASMLCLVSTTIGQWLITWSCFKKL